MMDAAFQKLSEAAKQDKFFPNGIELIYIKVEGGLSERIKVSAELRIAGEKGLGKPLASGGEAEGEPTPSAG